MGNRYNFLYFEAEFKKYLIAGNAGSSTVKNYLSDLHYFFSWVQSTHHIADLAPSEIPDTFSHSLIQTYNEYLLSSTTSENTVYRRLATLHKFFLYCIDQRWLLINPTDVFGNRAKVDEQEELITQYKQTLMSKQYTKVDIDRHINVIRDLVINSRDLKVL